MQRDRTVLPWPLRKIITVAVMLRTTGTSGGASTAEQIAAAFVLNRMEFLPASYPDFIEAWERLGEWQQHVKRIKHEYLDLIYAG